MENKFISVVVYLHNDADHVRGFMDMILPVLDESFSKYEIICVDDASSDDTSGSLKEYAARVAGGSGQTGAGSGGMISIVHMGFYQGLEASMNAGRDLAIGDFVYEFDHIYADYPASLIRDIYDRMQEGYDVVAASDLGYVRFTSGLFYRLFNRYSHSPNSIGSETFRIISRRAINRIKSMGIHIPYRKAIYSNCGLNTTVVSYTPDRVSAADIRRQLKNKNFGERSGLALDSFIYFTDIMEKISFVVSAVFLILSLGVMIYAVADHFLGSDISSGWPSLMCLVSLGFFGVFTLLTIILKYLSVMLDLVFRQQRYMVAGIDKLTDCR